MVKRLPSCDWALSEAREKLHTLPSAATTPYMQNTCSIVFDQMTVNLGDIYLVVHIYTGLSEAYFDAAGAANAVLPSVI
jgi:hypothetical protein